jgi:hypothetical protein
MKPTGIEALVCEEITLRQQKGIREVRHHSGRQPTCLCASGSSMRSKKVWIRPSTCGVPLLRSTSKAQQHHMRRIGNEIRFCLFRH